MRATVRKKIRCIGGIKYIVHEDGVIINKATGNVIKQQLTADGYLTVTLGKGAKRKPELVHRKVAEAFI